MEFICLYCGKPMTRRNSAVIEGGSRIHIGCHSAYLRKKEVQQEQIISYNKIKEMIWTMAEDDIYKMLNKLWEVKHADVRKIPPKLIKKIDGILSRTKKFIDPSGVVKFKDIAFNSECAEKRLKAILPILLREDFNKNVGRGFIKTGMSPLLFNKEGGGKCNEEFLRWLMNEFERYRMVTVAEEFLQLVREHNGIDDGIYKMSSLDRAYYSKLLYILNKNK